MQLIQKACAIAVPKNGTRRQRRPVYLWTNEIADLRKKCLRLRRLAQRAKRRDHDAAPLAADYQAAKKALKRTIKASQRRCRKEQPGCRPESVGIRPKREISLDAPGLSEVPQFTEEELLMAASSMRNRKAPGPDGLPAEIIKVVVQRGHLSRSMEESEACAHYQGQGSSRGSSIIQAYLFARHGWKTPGEADKTKAASSREGSGDHPGRQYGFRSGLSTIHAVLEVVTVAKMMERGNRRTRPLCLLATLDMRSAFNSVRWDLAREALERNFNVPMYLLRIVDDYLNERFLVYDTSDGPRSLELTSGAAQGSILGPDIRNIFYDGIFRMAVPDGTFLVGYEDDLAVVITARATKGVQLLLNQVMRRVTSWMEDHGLSLAAQKTEIVLIRRKRINNLRSFIVGDAAVQTKPAVKYLGVMLDNKLNYGEHIIRAVDKAAKVVASLGSFIDNVNGPRPYMRRLLMRVAEAVMLYGAEVWAEALRKQK
ncbi:uncharacterized protein LOC118448399 [Vespa mandarinia]|uniref:uncharacterized protein LOC118448399 n=1 Tax=Vespa mandarinia TaxID=7446 RepID=UPI001607C349|nr:uncharacterized protein LOC118448399 [Vespa mandarinia]